MKTSHHLDHLQHLETEAVHIMREVAAEFERPGIMFSGGKDSVCLLRLAEKAFRNSDIGEIRSQTSQPLVFDGYGTNRLTGSFILIKQGTSATVAAGLLFPPSETAKPDYNDLAI